MTEVHNTEPAKDALALQEQAKIAAVRAITASFLQDEAPLPNGVQTKNKIITSDSGIGIGTLSLEKSGSQTQILFTDKPGLSKTQRVSAWEIIDGKYCEGEYLLAPDGTYATHKIRKPRLSLSQLPAIIEKGTLLGRDAIANITQAIPPEQRAREETFFPREHIAVTKERAILSPEERAKRAWKDQADRLVLLGYPKALGMTEEAYRKSLPPFTEQRAAEKDGAIPLLVDPRVTIPEQLRLLSVENDLADEIPIPQQETTLTNTLGIATPSSPYQIWVQDGSTYTGQPPALPADERFLTLKEGLALLRERPDLYQSPKNAISYVFSFLGTKSESQSATPFVSYWDRGDYLGEFECALESQPSTNTTGGYPTTKSR